MIQKICDPVRKRVLGEYNPNQLSCMAVQRRLRRPQKPPPGSKGGGKGQRFKMCVPFLRGQCTKGAKCYNSHDERYKANALKRLEQRSAKGKGRGKGRGRGRRRGRAAGAVDGEADGEEEDVELDYIEVDIDLPAEPEEKDEPPK